MVETLRVNADVDFSVTVDGERMSGTLRGTGSDLELSVNNSHLLGGSGTEVARELAGHLAAQGLRLRVVADRPLVTLGVTKASFWQRRVTGSRHIRVESLGAAVRLLRLRRATGDATPLVPPSSPLPLLPTFLRRPRMPSTTHDPDRGGYPRLVLQPDHYLPGGRRKVFHLGAVTTIGSEEEADIRLPEAARHQAEVQQTEDDEFVLVPLRSGLQIRVNGAPALDRALLRTGSRVEIGPWTLVFAREEYADHGRPYGGRLGGEVGRQLPQPPREASWSARGGEG